MRQTSESETRVQGTYPLTVQPTKQASTKCNRRPKMARGGNYCEICGAPLSDNNVTGIGFECAAALYAAQKHKAKQEGLALKVHVYISSVVRPIFLEAFANVKFRSEFKRSFYASIESNERISAKQLHVMFNWLIISRKDKQLDGIQQAAKEYEERVIVSTDVTRDEIEHARRFIKSNHRK